MRDAYVSTVSQSAAFPKACSGEPVMSQLAVSVDALTALQADPTAFLSIEAGSGRSKPSQVLGWE